MDNGNDICMIIKLQLSQFCVNVYEAKYKSSVQRQRGFTINYFHTELDPFASKLTKYSDMDLDEAYLLYFDPLSIVCE